jgi:hypothetical protein
MLGCSVFFFTAQAETDPGPGVDIHNGRTNRIARVQSVTPSEVYVIYEGNMGGRKIPRSALPSQLARLYPYDAQEEAAYRARQEEARREGVRADLRRREQALQKQISQLEAAEAADQKQRTMLNHWTNNGRRGPRTQRYELRCLREKRQDTQRRLDGLHQQLAEIQSRIDAL